MAGPAMNDVFDHLLTKREARNVAFFHHDGCKRVACVSGSDGSDGLCAIGCDDVDGKLTNVCLPEMRPNSRSSRHVLGAVDSAGDVAVFLDTGDPNIVRSDVVQPGYNVGWRQCI